LLVELKIKNITSQAFACKSKQIFESCMKRHLVNIKNVSLSLLEQKSCTVQTPVKRNCNVVVHRREVAAKAKERHASLLLSVPLNKTLIQGFT
jgi:hypothetical protein